MKPVKIVIIGAGSASFGLNSLASLLRELSLRGSTLALDPIVDDLDVARAVLDDYLETHKETLPQFHGHWHL